MVNKYVPKPGIINLFGSVEYTWHLYNRFIIAACLSWPVYTFNITGGMWGNFFLGFFVYITARFILSMQWFNFLDQPSEYQELNPAYVEPKADDSDDESHEDSSTP